MHQVGANSTTSRWPVQQKLFILGTWHFSHFLILSHHDSRVPVCGLRPPVLRPDCRFWILVPVTPSRVTERGSLHPRSNLRHFARFYTLSQTLTTTAPPQWLCLFWFVSFKFFRKSDWFIRSKNYIVFVCKLFKIFNLFWFVSFKFFRKSDW